MSLEIPEHYKQYVILGIDPGMKTGVGALTIDYATNTLLKTEAYTIKVDRLYDRSGVEEDVHGERKVNLINLQHAVTHYLEQYHPSEVAIEAPFYNRLMPMAYGSLMEVVTMVISSVTAFDTNIRITMYPPMSVKKLIGAKAVARDTEKGKILVKMAISRIPEIMNTLQHDLDELSEHAIDGVAIAYTLFKSKGI